MLVFITLCLLPLPAMAYIDPGTGSLWLQALIAGMVGCLFYIRQMWSAIRRWFSRDKKIDDHAEQ